jgi:hypothetical protein
MVISEVLRHEPFFPTHDPDTPCCQIVQKLILFNFADTRAEENTGGRPEHEGVARCDEFMELKVASIAILTDVAEASELLPS